MMTPEKFAERIFKLAENRRPSLVTLRGVIRCAHKKTVNRKKLCMLYERFLKLKIPSFQSFVLNTKLLKSCKLESCCWKLLKELVAEADLR